LSANQVTSNLLGAACNLLSFYH